MWCLLSENDKFVKFDSILVGSILICIRRILVPNDLASSTWCFLKCCFQCLLPPLSTNSLQHYRQQPFLLSCDRLGKTIEIIIYSNFLLFLWWWMRRLCSFTITDIQMVVIWKIININICKIYWSKFPILKRSKIKILSVSDRYKILELYMTGNKYN